ncbi:MAG: helix-turn-helix domain-containing protein [Bacilli bacterium]|nr:helix-turn-helix domain-containing protein [Bacilli bacterium]
MKRWKQFTFEQRKSIRNGLSKKLKLIEIAEIIGFDPTAISKEIKRNRILHYKSATNEPCKFIKRYPYCCNACNKRYGRCFLTQYLYEPNKAQKMAEAKLINSRRGIDMTEVEFITLDNTIKQGVDNGHSIYHTVKNNPHLKISVPTIYRYIDKGLLKIKKIDLPYAVTYKKRKKKSQYEYNENKNIDRTGRTYLDFLKFMFDNPNCLYVQMDFLGHVQTDNKKIFTMTIPHLHFVMLFIFKKPTADKIVTFFNVIEKQIGNQMFTKIFTCVLTDRDPCFASFYELEKSTISNNLRTKMFYCDPNASCQKANVEQMNKQLRKFFPRKKSIGHLTQEDVNKVASIINSTRVASLSGFTPNEALINLLGVETLKKLNNIIL